MEPKRSQDVPASRKFSWRAIAYAAGAVAGLITQRLLVKAWSTMNSSEPPALADRRAPWADALSWAVATGVGMSISRLLAVRTAAAVWEATTHEPPPDAGLDG